MTRIAAPMVGGMLTAPLLSMLVIPAAWCLSHRKKEVRFGSVNPALSTQTSRGLDFHPANVSDDSRKS
jgi:hypothetical protein